MVFSSSHVQMWELDHKEGWASKNWCFWTVVLEKTLEGPLNSKEIKPLNPKGNQPWIFIGVTDVEAEAPILCHLMRRANTLEKTLMLGKIEGRRKRGWQGMKWLEYIADSMDMSLSKLREIMEDRKAWHAAVHGVTKSWTQFSDWTATNKKLGSLTIQILSCWHCGDTLASSLTFLCLMATLETRYKMYHNRHNTALTWCVK